mgnify:CR=1 FL=1
MQAVYADIRNRGAELVVLSPELAAHSQKLATENKLTFPIARDAASATADAFGLAFTFPDELRALYLALGLDLDKRNGEASWRMPMPARFVLDQKGIIRYAAVDPDYTRRPEPEETLAALQAIA